MSIINSEDTNTLVEWNLSDNVTSTPQDSDNLPSDCSSQQRSHLEYVLLDYKQFLAARIIQSNVRGWLCRLDLRKRNLAATTISRWWRGFWVRNMKFTVIEAELQERIMEYFDDMAIKIQSIFRGWHARMNYQDFQGMQSLRMQYAEEMLSELATSLHKMRKDRLLPGIYCLRGSDFLKKIEGLSLTFGYRFHNGRMRAAIAQRRAMVARQRHDFQKSMFFTPAPFPAPASQLANQPDFCAYKRIGTQQQRLFLLYDKCNRDSHVKKIHLNLSARLRSNMEANREVIRRRFCKEFIKRTIRGHPNQSTYQPSSALIQQFIDDLLNDAGEYNCYCSSKVHNDLETGM